MTRRRESIDERQPKAALGRHDRDATDEPRTARPGIMDGARARGLHGQHVVDAREPNLGHPPDWAPDAEEPEGVVRPEDLPSRRARDEDAGEAR